MHYNPSLDVELHTDASGLGTGAVVVERDPQTDYEHVVAYAGRTLNVTERNWCATERGSFAVDLACIKFRPYLVARHVKVVVDYHALCFSLSKTSLNQKLTKWALYIGEYQLEIIYKSFKKDLNADCLSRHPVDPPTEMDEPMSLFTLESLPLTKLQREDSGCTKLIRIL